MRRLRQSAARAVLVLALLASPPVFAEKLPPVWGYGVKSCADFLSAAQGWDTGGEPESTEYRRYQDWLTGLVTGLNLATGKDVLRGADINGAMGRIRAHCGGHPKDDFFTATMDLVRMLSGLR
jgi:hypothetical protein